MRLFGKEKTFDFMRLRKAAMFLSIALLLAAIASLAVRGLNLGLDFTGGTLLELGYPQPVELHQVRGTLETAGYGSAVVQHFGTSQDVLVRLPPKEGLTTAELSEDVFAALKKADTGVEKRRQEYVGPQVGEELTEDGGLAMLYALIGILVYVSLRFQYRFALGAIAALVHDVLITLGVFSLLHIEFDLTVLAALLAVIGYSLNDTIVVSDRIRENFRKMRKGDRVGIINASLNQTLSRTLITSLTTLLVLLALFFLGGELIHGFATALIIGVIIGTYSSIYVASSILVAMKISKEDLMPVKKEGAELDENP